MINRKIIGLAASVLFGLGTAGAAGPLAALRVQGSQMVDPQGRVVTLKGANLGNWHVIEFWMLGLSGLPDTPKDQYDLEQVLTGRFGEAEKDRLMDVYRSSWIQERDFDNLKKFNFNLVRLPMNYRLMEDDRHPFQLKKDAWRWIDRAVDLSESRGMYVILDMHGAQGGQSPYDHTGHSDQNHLKDSPTNQKRLAWLWGEIAKRYRNRGAVVAYDVFNEPYGMPKDAQVATFRQAYAEIRKNDPEKLIFAHGHYDGFSHYGDPKANGWHNVGFQMHYYPGLFGGGSPTVPTHVKHLESLKSVAARVKELNVPFIVGEMNVVFDAAGGAGMMKRYYDAHASYNWMTTMWAYKAGSDEGGFGSASWGAVTNVEPKRTVNFRKDSKEEIEAYFKGFATDKLAINEKLRAALTDPNYVPDPLPPAPVTRKAAPTGVRAGWAQTDIGSPLAGGYAAGSGESFDLYGGGSDIWGSEDQFRFLHQSFEGDFTLEVTVDSVEAIDTYTKAGLMIRQDLGASAPFALVSVFPSGELQLAHRDAAKTDAVGEPAKNARFPGLQLRLVRANGRIAASYAVAGGGWQALGSVADKLPRRVFVGPFALSHDNSQLVKIGYRDLKLTQ